MVGNILEALFDSVIWPILLFLVIWWIPSYIVILLINRHFRKIEKELERWIWLRKVKIRNGDVWGNKVIVEYQPPKWLNPTEVWFLYDWSVWKPDIICMVYKWVNMWLVSLEYKWWEIVVKKLLNIKSWLPSYDCRTIRHLQQLHPQLRPKHRSLYRCEDPGQLSVGHHAYCRTCPRSQLFHRSQSEKY